MMYEGQQDPAMIYQIKERPPAHRIFTIPELLHLIFSALAHDDFFHLALVNRQFYAIAIPLLWKFSRSIVPLLKLLCDDNTLWEEVARDEEDLRCPRLISNDDVQRFDRYAHFIRHVWANEGGPDNGVYELFPMLHEAHNIRLRSGDTRDLLPRLQTVDWHVVSTPSLRVLTALMGSGVETLQIILCDEFEDFEDLRCLSEQIQRLKPALTLLTFAGLGEREHDYFHMRRCVAGILQCQPKLERLRSEKAILSWVFAKLPIIYAELRALDFGYGSYTLAAFDPQSFVSPQYFPSLQTIEFTIKDDGPTYWTPFFRAIGPSNITNIKMADESFPRKFRAAEVYEFFAAIAKSCPLLQYLQLLEIRFSGDAARGHLVGSLRPLLQCHDLISIILWSNPAEDIEVCHFLSDDEVTDMAKAWPKLERIVLTSPEELSDPPAPPPLTLKSVAALCTYCPQIHNIKLIVDATRYPPLDGGSLPYQPSITLRYLQLVKSHIKDAKEVALWISKICPQSELRTHNSDRTRRKTWMVVKDYLRVLQMHDRSIEMELDKVRKEKEALERQLEGTLKEIEMLRSGRSHP